MRVRTAVCCYLSVALGLPLLNGGYRHAKFWEHAAQVTCLVVGIACALGAARVLWKQLRMARKPPPTAVRGCENGLAGRGASPRPRISVASP